MDRPALGDHRRDDLIPPPHEAAVSLAGQTVSRARGRRSTTNPRTAADSCSPRQPGVSARCRDRREAARQRRPSSGATPFVDVGSALARSVCYHEPNATSRRRRLVEPEARSLHGRFVAVISRRHRFLRRHRARRLSVDRLSTRKGSRERKGCTAADRRSDNGERGETDGTRGRSAS